MRITSALSAGLTAIVLLVCSTSTVRAHTWVEEVRKIASNGTFVGTPGYIRNFTPRSGPQAGNVDNNLHTILGVEVKEDVRMCRPNQLKGQQTNNFPALSAAPGDQIALRYLENGHVTKWDTPAGHTAGSGTVFIYATQDAADTDTYRGIHRVWNAEGTGGDKRGKLIATRPFDDGRCFQFNDKSASRQAKVPGFTGTQQAATLGTTDMLCQNDIQIPSDVGASGTYTLYWVWEWPIVNSEGKILSGESYTSCIDISMTANAVPDAGAFSAQAVTGEGAGFVAVQNQLRANPFLVDPAARLTIAADNIPALQTGPPVAPPAPSTPPVGVPPAPAPAQPPINAPAAGLPAPSAPPAQPQAIFVTVTVTAANQVVTVTITKENPVGTPAVPPNSPAVPPNQPAVPVSPPVLLPIQPAAVQASTSTVTVTVPNGVPTPAPFLSPNAEVKQGSINARAEPGAVPRHRRKLRFHEY